MRLLLYLLCSAVIQLSVLGASSLDLLHRFNPLAPQGAYPWSSFIQGPDGNFYGAMEAGGSAGAGTVVQVTRSGAITVLYSFTNGVDGAYPRASLVFGTDGFLYGTAEYGGSDNVGTVFKLTTNGTFTALYSFRTNQIDGTYPRAGLVQATNGLFYGTTHYSGAGGLYAAGTIFAISSDGVLTYKHAFTGVGNDGANPTALLIIGTDGNLYGTTEHGGNRSQGTVFRMSPDGVWTNLHSFTNIDGTIPWAGLVQGGDGNFYGTTVYGGTYGYGTIFRVSSNGTFTSLYSFSNGSDGSSPYSALVVGQNGNFYGTTHGASVPFQGTNNIGTIFQITPSGNLTTLYTFVNGADGANPTAGLAMDTNGNFFGCAEVGGVVGWGGPSPTYGQILGGTSGWGTIFSITPAGAFTPLSAFASGTDGANPGAAMIQASDGHLYGVTERGGTNDDGTVFRMDWDGTVSMLHSFTAGLDGAVPAAALAQGADGNLYGTTYGGGPNGAGAVFKIAPAGALSVLHTFTNGLDGGHPLASLTQGDDGNFYGTTTDGGGPAAGGTVFQMTSDGTMTTLHSFTNGVDGSYPMGLARGANGLFYGVAQNGGARSNGVVFTISAAGVFNTIYSFTGGQDGATPAAALTLGADQNFYGVCTYGGSNGAGTVFKVTPAGALTLLYGFDYTNAAYPLTPLVVGADGNLYGTTQYGGDNGSGIVFQMTTNGSFSILHSYTYNEIGNSYFTAISQATNGNFYIACEGGGGSFTGSGAVFRLIVPPVIRSITATADSNVLTWLGQPGQKYQMQYTSDLGSAIWTNYGAQTVATQPITSSTNSLPPSRTGFYRIMVAP